jgi:hypothetical protein
MKITCPNCPKETRFDVSAHEVHDWTVDEKGNFVEDKGCVDMAHKPESGDHFTCQSCGGTAKVVE